MVRMIRIGCLFVMFIFGKAAYGQEPGEAFDRQTFYKVMQSGKIEELNKELNTLKTISVSGKEAFEGALVMKKAGLTGPADQKLSLFKSGHKKLEAAIQKDSENVEFRFLRLMIQEHAPGILGYKSSIKKDSEYIRKSYKGLPQVVQNAVMDYSKKSKVLKLQDS